MCYFLFEKIHKSQSLNADYSILIFIHHECRNVVALVARVGNDPIILMVLMPRCTKKSSQRKRHQQPLNLKPQDRYRQQSIGYYVTLR